MADVVAKFKLEDGSELSIDKSFISSLKSVSESTTDAGSINYGTLANTGSIEIQDGNGYISKLIDDGSLPISNLNVVIELNDNVFQNHITTDSDYNTEDNTLNISLSNFINDFDILKYKGYVYQNKGASVYELLYDVLDSYFHIGHSGIDSMFSNDALEYVKKIYVEYPTIEYGKTYREVLDELCTIAQLNAFATKDNLLKFVLARPVYTSEDKIINLKLNDIVNDLTYTKTLKNKFDGVEMSKTNVQDLIDYDTVVFPARVDLSGTSTSSFSSSTQSNQNIATRSQFINAATFYYEIVSYIKSDYYTYTGKVTIPKTSSDNLSQIQSINENLLRNTEFAYTMKYNKYSSYASADSVWDRGDDKVYVGTITYGSESFDGVVTEGGVVTDTSSYTASLPDGTNTTSSTSTTPAIPNVSFSSDNNNYYVTYKICVAKNITKLGGVGRWTAASTSEIDIDLSGVRESYKPLELTFSIYGNKRTITFSDMPASSSNIENAKTKANIKSSKLLQTRTTYNGQEISDVIKSNILTDYRSGISDGKLTLNKDLVDIGDFIKYPNDRRVWKVVGKEFVYDGEYLFPISVMQCLKPYSRFGLFDDYGEVIYSWDELIEKGFITQKDGELTNASIQDDGILKPDNSITSLGWRVFYDDTHISEIVLNDVITTIRPSSMIVMNGLVKFDTGDVLKEIGYSAFERCQNLKTVTIGKNVEKIGSGAFSGCPSLSLILYKTNKHIREDGVDDLFRDSGSQSGGITVVIDSDITETVYGLFATYDGDNYIKHIEFKTPNLTTISGKTFLGCAIESIEIPNSVTTIGASAFENSKLKEIEIPDSVTSIGQDCFNNCSKLEYVKLSKNITKLENSLFRYCTSLKEIIIPDSVVEIASSVFQKCNSMEMMEIPIPYNASSSFKIKNILYDSSGESPTYVPSSLKKVVLKPGSSSEIGIDCFSECVSVEEVVIKSGITRISNNAFIGATGLKRVVFEDTSGWKILSKEIDVSDPEANAIMLTQTNARDSWTNT